MILKQKYFLFTVVAVCIFSLTFFSAYLYPNSGPKIKLNTNNLNGLIKNPTAFIQSFLSKEKLPRAYVVQSGSMEPAVKTGSIIISLPEKIYSQNDIVTFKSGKSVVTHRIMSRTFPDGIGNSPVYKTSGDANKDFDPLEVKDDQIVGKVVFTIPYLGYAANLAKTPKGFILLVIIPATIIIYEEVKFLFIAAGSNLSNKFKKIVGKKSKDRSGVHIPKSASVFIPIFGIAMVFAGFTGSFFSDQEAENNNVLQAGIWTTPTTSPSPIPSQVANHVVISEVQIAGDGEASSDDEFVELYNPTSSPVVMDGWKLTRKNSSGTEANLVLSLNGTVPAHGYFLIADSDGYNGAATADANYSASSNQMTNNYTVLLYSDNQITLVDKLGFGSSFDPETTSFASSPGQNESVERKAYSASTQAAMEGGLDSDKGNGYDSDNNSTDFILRTVSDPQNSSSLSELP